MAKKLEKLTPEQEARFPEFRDEYLRRGLSTEPADRAAAEEAVKDAYRAGGLEPPQVFIWLASPMAGAIGAAIISNHQVRDQVRDQVWAQVGAQVGDQVWAQVRDQVRAQVGAQVWAQVGDQVRDQVGAQVGDQVGDQVRDQVGAQVRDQVWDQVWAQVGAQVWDQVGAQVWAQVWDQVWAQVGAQVRDQVGAQVWAQVWAQVSRAGYGQHDAGWMSFYAYFAEVCGISDAMRLAPLSRLSAAAGWWWPFERFCILTDRPSALHRDAENRLHCETGPAILYRDGWGVSSWHGTRIPDEWIMRRATIDPSEILKAPNTEQRAAGFALIGPARMASVLKERVIDHHNSPDIGDLIELTLPGLPEAGRFLRATCPRNGIIIEGVPRISEIDGLPIETALAAQAWRIGDPASEYIHPTRRT